MAQLDFRRYGFDRFDVAGRPALVSRTGYTGSDGFEIYLGVGDIKRLDQALQLGQKVNLSKRQDPVGVPVGGYRERPRTLAH